MLLTKVVGRERRLVALATCLIGASAAVPAAATLGIGAAFAVAAICIATAVPLTRLLPAELDGSAGHRPLLAMAWGIVVLGACLQVGRLSCFMADDSRLWGSTVPAPMVAHHACLGAYIEAAALTERGAANIYAEEYYPAYRGSCGVPGSAFGIAHLGGWMSDPYLYPPPFLIVPRLVLMATRDFHRIRLVWFVANALLLLSGIVTLASWRRDAAGRRWLLAVPAIFASPPTLLLLQFGQVHGLAVLAALGGMIASEATPALGGALLATAIVAKITPAVLLMPLAAGRRWRALGWTAGCVATCALIALAWFGPRPFEAFAHYELPRLVSGDAFSFLDRQESVFLASRNFSIQGIATRVRLLGLPIFPPDAFHRVALLVLASVCVVGWIVGRTRASTVSSLAAWLALLNLATLCSPAAPSAYVTVPALWLVALMSPADTATRWRKLFTIAAWMLIVGAPPLADHVDLVVSGLGQVAMIAMCVWPLARDVTLARRESAFSAFRTSVSSSR